jgi:hypothetical protein
MSGNTVLLLVLGGCALLAAGALGLIQWRIGRLKRAVAAARAWPTVPGRVVGSRIEMRSIALPRGGRGVSYGAIVEYEYQTGGWQYRSTRYSLSGPRYFSFERRAKRLLARFPAGAAVTVHYDVAEPRDGVIALDAPFIVTLRVIFWLCLALFAWLFGGMLLFEPLFGPAPLVRL